MEVLPFSHMRKVLNHCPLQVKVGQHMHNLFATDHFMEKMKTLDVEVTPELIYYSTVILERPNRLGSLLRNRCIPTIYLWRGKAVMVLELSDGEYKLLRTAYSPKTSAWIKQYLNSTFKVNRTKFHQFFDGKEKLTI